MSNERITKAAIAERIEAVEKRIDYIAERLHQAEQAFERGALSGIEVELTEIRFLIERDLFFPVSKPTEAARLAAMKRLEASAMFHSAGHQCVSLPAAMSIVNETVKAAA